MCVLKWPHSRSANDFFLSPARGSPSFRLRGRSVVVRHGWSPTTPIPSLPVFATVQLTLENIERVRFRAQAKSF